MTAEQARTFTTQLMSQLLPSEFSVGSRDAIKPNMLTVPELMARLGLDPSQQSLSAIKQLLDNSTNAAYDKEFQSQKESEAAFVRSLADASQLDSLKDVLGTGIYSGQNKGMLAASVLSTLLGEQSNSVDDLNALIQNRGAIASGRTASLTDNASTALTQQQAMQQALAALSKDYYANQIQQQTNELEANATYDDTAAGYYAANASTFADLLASLLGEDNGYRGSSYAYSNSEDESRDGSIPAGARPVKAGINSSPAKQGANLSVDPNFTPTNARDAAIRNTLSHITGKSPSTLNTNQLQKSGSATTDVNKVGTNNFNNIYVEDLLSRMGEPKQPTFSQAPSSSTNTPSSAFNNAYVQDLTSRMKAPKQPTIQQAPKQPATIFNPVQGAVDRLSAALKTTSGAAGGAAASPIIAAAKNAVSGVAGPVSNNAIKNANIAISQKPTTVFNPVQGAINRLSAASRPASGAASGAASGSVLNAALKAASGAAALNKNKGSVPAKKPLTPTTAAQARKNAMKK